MDSLWRTVVWKQFGAAMDMLDDAVAFCPDDHWRMAVWPDPSYPPQHAEFWYVAYHTVFWTDLYLFGAEEGFAPPAPYALIEQDENGPYPDRPYTKDEVRAYLASLRQRVRAAIETLTDEQAGLPVNFGWMEEGETVTYLETQLYSMRHVMHHAAQLSLLLGRDGVSGDDLDWVPRARADVATS